MSIFNPPRLYAYHASVFSNYAYAYSTVFSKHFDAYFSLRNIYWNAFFDVAKYSCISAA